MGSPRFRSACARARNCAIVLRGLALQGKELAQAVELLEPGPLDQATALGLLGGGGGGVRWGEVGCWGCWGWGGVGGVGGR